MTLIQALDVAIALTAVFALLSLLGTAILEAIVAAANARGLR